MISRALTPDMRTLPGDILLGLLHMENVAIPARSMAIISAMTDSGPSEIYLLTNQMKLNIIFTQGIESFVKVFEENYRENRFFVFKTNSKKIILQCIPAMVEESISEGKYVAFWGPELTPGIKKNAWPLELLDRSRSYAIGEFQAIDVIKEDGMYDLLYKIRRDGKRS